MEAIGAIILLLFFLFPRFLPDSGETHTKLRYPPLSLPDVWKVGILDVASSEYRKRENIG